MGGALSTLKLAVAFLLAGFLFDSVALLVPGVALALLAGGAFAWVELAARGARVKRPAGPPTVVEDEPYPFRVQIRRGAVPPRGALEDPLLDEPLPVRALIREPVTQASLSIAFPRRGRRRLEPAVLVVRDPLGLHRREVRSGDGGELLVLPRIEPVLAPGQGDGDGGAGDAEAEEPGDGAGISALEARAIEFEIDGLRPYREGSPASRIHWPAVARTGDLIERRLVDGGDRSPLVVLDAGRPESEDSLDMAVRAAGSLCVHLARAAGGCALLLPRERRPLAVDSELRAWPAAHAKLAMVEAGGGVPAVGRAGHTGAIVWVSARGGRPPHAARGPSAPSFVVSPHPVAGLPVAFRVAGCAGQAVGARARRRARTRRAAA
jgi:uncharacterized protein (DUF58 family)